MKPKVEFSEFKGNKMISFYEKEDDKYPFSFGAGKAKKMLLYIKEHGLEDFKNKLESLGEEK
jgi:hypothetical protein